MKRFSIGLVVVSLAVAACQGSTLRLDGEGTMIPGSDLVVCIGDPDRGGVVCQPRADFWNCDAMPNGFVKCSRPGSVTPGGSASWTCTHDGTNVVCSASGDAAAGGAGGWDCTSAGGTTTCTSTSGADVPGSGSWQCRVDAEFGGLVCEGEGGGTSGGGSGSEGASGGTGSGSGSGSGEEGGSSGGTGSGEEGGSSGSGSGTQEQPPPPTGPVFSCSYAMVAFIYKGQIWVMKIPAGGNTCSFTNKTSNDTEFSDECNGATYGNPSSIMSRNGAAMTPYGGPESCDDLFTIKANEVWAKPGVTMIFGAAHNGSFPNHFATTCPGASGSDYMAFPIDCRSK